MAENQEKKESAKYSSASKPAYGLGGGTELLNQIAAPDIKEEREKEKKKRKKTVKKPFSSLSFVLFMRTTLFIDAFKRKHQGLCEVFSYIWLIFILLVYAGGLTMIITINYSKMNFPNIVEHYLKRNKIEVETLKVEDNSLSKIRLTNVQDKDKTYHIRNMFLHSSFGDFLRRKIHRVEFDYLTIKITDTGSKINISSLFPLLLNLDDQKDITIDSVIIRKALLKIEGKDYEIPVNFSMNAQFGQKSRMDIPLSIRDKNTNLTGSLVITRIGNDIIWNIKNLRGNTDFLSKQQENVSGSVVLKTKEFSPTEIDINTTFSLGATSKNIKVKLNNKKKGFVGTASYTEEIKQENESLKIIDTFLAFENINIDSFSSINSLSPVNVKIFSLIQPTFEIKNLETTLYGNLSCKKLNCSYDITDPTTVSLHNLIYKGSSHTYTSEKPFQFIANPQEKVVQISRDFASLKLKGEGLNYEGTKNINNAKLVLDAETFSLETADLNPDRTASFSAQNLNFTNSSQEIKNASVFIKNIYDPEDQFSLQTNYIHLFKNEAIKKPFALNIESLKGRTRATALFAGGRIQARFDGSMDISTGHFKGTIFVPPIDLRRSSDLPQLTNLFPDGLEDLAGKMSLYGKIDWKNDTQISGPLYLSLKDVYFTKGNTKVKNLNTVLTLQSLKPFISQSAQNVAIDEIESGIALQNIRSSVKFENQQLRIFSLTGSFADIKLTADHTAIPYKSENTPIYFRNGSIRWKDITPYLNVSGLSLEGTGNIYLPLEITPQSINVKNGEVKLINTTVKYTGTNPELKNALFKNNDEYIIRSGTLTLNSRQNNTIDAYINIEGREKNATEHQFYKTDKTFNFNELFKPEQSQPIPLQIQKLQHQLSGQ